MVVYYGPPDMSGIEKEIEKSNSSSTRYNKKMLWVAVATLIFTIIAVAISAYLIL